MTSSRSPYGWRYAMPTWALSLLCTLPWQRASSADPEAAHQPSKEQVRFFESEVRPLLIERCTRCHGPKEQQGGLRLDARKTILAGGESGPSVVPGKVDESLLIEAVRYQSLEMPPDRRLTKKEVAILEKWVAMGVPWPHEGTEDVPLVPRGAGYEITDDDRSFWSFRPVDRPPVPIDILREWQGGSAIDAFIWSRLGDEHLVPSQPARRRELMRRVTFDLIGLPPSPEDVEQFATDSNPLAYQRLLDRLMASPHFGERWARHWLDVVRFAQTHGYERDDEKPNAWRFRDYVIRAFNEDKPYSQFIREQLAGDELAAVTLDSMIATGFYRIGVWDDEPDDKTAALFDNLDDIVRTTGESFLGLTIGCARCHDHKFDPIPQADYYQLLSFVQNIAPTGVDKSETHWQLNPDAVFVPAITPIQAKEIEERRKTVEAELARIKSSLDAASEAGKAALETKKKSLEAVLSSLKFPQALSVREKTPDVGPTHILIRGSHLTKGKTVRPAFLSVLGAQSAVVAEPPDGGPYRQFLRDQGVGPTSGRRLALAEWIASGKNPLTSRVMVNRLWHYTFGRGIVSSPSDFGRTGRPPSHPRLLDWLASEFVRREWSVKSLLREVVSTETYRQSSKDRPRDGGGAAADPQFVDPDNRLLWRQNLRRLQAESIRDSVLALCGTLNREMGGRGAFPRLSAEVLASQSRPGTGWDTQPPHQRNRRSVYVYIKRTLGVPLLESFDQPTPDKSEPDRTTTTIAPQALILLNSEFIAEQSARLAERLHSEAGDRPADQIELAFRLALQRGPSADELAVCKSFIERRASREGSDEAPSPLAEFCRLVINLNEFVYID